MYLQYIMIYVYLSNWGCNNENDNLQWSDLLLFISIFNCDISSELFHGVHLSEKLNQGVFTVFFLTKLRSTVLGWLKNGNACIKSHQIYLFS